MRNEVDVVLCWEDGKLRRLEVIERESDEVTHAFAESLVELGDYDRISTITKVIGLTDEEAGETLH